MTRKLASIATVALLGAAMFSCKEVNRQSSPVQLVVTTTQILQQIDLKPGALNCNQSIGTVLIKNVLIQNAQPSGNLPTNLTLDDVNITEYRISYARTDGGTSIPAPFTRSIAITVPVNGAAANLGTFLAFQPDALSQAPFAALLPQNGGRDPQTGRAVVQMNIILEVFGQTLAGERVSGSTRIPLDFCFDCAGCA
jgi:hypothetical protein